MATQELECFGGPADGKSIPVDDTEAVKEMCLVQIYDNLPHFYVTVERDDGTLCFEYAGPSPYDAVDKLRATGCHDADDIEASLDEKFGSRDDFKHE